MHEVLTTTNPPESPEKARKGVAKLSKDSNRIRQSGEKEFQMFKSMLWIEKGGPRMTWEMLNSVGSCTPEIPCAAMQVDYRITYGSQEALEKRLSASPVGSAFVCILKPHLVGYRSQ